MAARAARRPQHGLLSVYLNGHLAGSTAGVELARRMAASAEPGSAAAGTLEELAAEIAADRNALLEIMAALGIPRRSYKVAPGGYSSPALSSARTPAASGRT